VRGDLIRILGGLMKRKDKFDAILVETTGLADPSPVVQTFFVDDEVKEKTTLDSITTVVDAKHILLRLKDAREASEQIALADQIILNKTDLVSADELKIVERRIRELNPLAPIHRTERCEIDLDTVLHRHAFDLQRLLDIEPALLDSEHEHTHESDISSVSLSSTKSWYLKSLSLMAPRPFTAEEPAHCSDPVFVAGGHAVRTSVVPCPRG
jgi:G3E family GTPase